MSPSPFSRTFLSRAAVCASLLLLLSATAGRAQGVPSQINYQGRVVVGSTNFSGTGAFKFALVNAGGTATYWSNDGSSTNGSQPTNAVPLTVSSGLYALALGDPTLTNMTAIPASVFTNNGAVYLRVWFNDGTNGSQVLTPDARITAVGYAMLAQSVPAGSITATQIAAGAVGTTQLASGAVTAADIASGTITSTQLAAGSVGSTQLASNLKANGTFTIGSLLALPATASASVGLVTLGGFPFLHAYGTGNTFLGSSTGNFTMTGASNTAIGYQAYTQNTSGTENTAVGYGALYANTIGNDDTAVGSGALLNNEDGQYNTAVGDDALKYTLHGNSNTAVGHLALSGNSIGDYNTAVGSAALRNNLYYSNTGIGDSALYANTMGYGNTATGASALTANTVGGNNVADGFSALEANTMGNLNTAVGDSALTTNTLGNYNTATGGEALLENTTGSYNTATGYDALTASTSDHNTADGYKALAGVTTGGTNTALGYQAGLNVTTGSNNIDIANGGANTDSNTIHIGVQGTQTATFVAGISGATAASGVAVYVNNSGQLGTLTSSARYKQDIRDMDRASEAILALRPVDFEYKPEIDPAATPQFGLVAEEVEKVCPALVAHDEKGQAYTVRYEAVNAMLLNEFLKEHRRAQNLEQRLADLEARDEAREERLAALEQLLPPPTGIATARAAITGAPADGK